MSGRFVEREGREGRGGGGGRGGEGGGGGGERERESIKTDLLSLRPQEVVCILMGCVSW